MRKKSNVIKYIPNILTVIRFVFIPFIVLAIAYNHYIASIVLFTLSSITDVCDGFIARKFNAISDFGKLMDPLADKLTQLSILLTLTFKEIVPPWIVIVLIIKDVSMVVGASFLYGKQLVVSSRWHGKLTTVLIYSAVISSFSIEIFDWPKFDIYLYDLAVIFAIFSFFSYIHYFYGKGYLPNKEELKKTTEIKSYKEK